MDWYIEGGVRRAVAARESGVSKILAVIFEENKPPRKALVSLNELNSPKRSISASDPRYLRALQGMSTRAGRAKMPPIDVQPLGEPGQSASIPLDQVKLDP